MGETCGGTGGQVMGDGWGTRGQVMGGTGGGQGDR